MKTIKSTRKLFSYYFCNDKLAILCILVIIIILLTPYLSFIRKVQWIISEEFGEDGRECQIREISTIDDANIFYKVVGASKKGRVIALVWRGMSWS